ncbi:hypothetical protein GmarT_01540 [Gimesia maris]|uniref:Uncharacterized protein n=1 Tax=Gimesia maris TaxID=122 RepID=A0ABX5YF43_9PLAN|nr:hypothetical protein CA11_01590 [Gimesia maris]QEG14321.1 hypothetical protein GmarT_01540 [Gimesia maris]
MDEVKVSNSQGKRLFNAVNLSYHIRAGMTILIGVSLGVVRETRRGSTENIVRIPYFLTSSIEKRSMCALRSNRRSHFSHG